MSQPPSPWAYPYPLNLTDFQPQARNVSAIASGPNFTTLVETFDPHQYLDGLIVKLFIPGKRTMPDSFYEAYPITVISEVVFSIPLNSTNFPAVSIPADQECQSIPVAELNRYLTSAMNNEA